MHKKLQLRSKLDLLFRRFTQINLLLFYTYRSTGFVLRKFFSISWRTTAWKFEFRTTAVDTRYFYKSLLKQPRVLGFLTFQNLDIFG
jgi:hypothetical protein